MFCLGQCVTSFPLPILCEGGFLCISHTHRKTWLQLKWNYIKTIRKSMQLSPETLCLYIVSIQYNGNQLTIFQILSVDSLLNPPFVYFCHLRRHHFRQSYFTAPPVFPPTCLFLLRIASVASKTASH